MADIQFNIDAALAKLGDLVAKHGLDAVNLAAQVVQVNAIDTLVSGLGYATIGGALFMAARFSLRRLQAMDSSYDGALGWGLALGSTSAATLLLAYFAVACLTNVWAWVALFNPKLALAHDVLAKLTGA